jgi:hypothetical protein
LEAAVLKWTGSEFRITRQLLDNAALDKWLAQEGQIVLAATVRQTRMRWFFGRKRARAALLNGARDALKPGGRLAIALKRELDELPKIVRKTGTMIRRQKHRDLYTNDETVSLVVVPRAIVRNEVTIHLMNTLMRTDSLARFKGLPARVLREAAAQAEVQFFDFISGGKSFLHRSGKAMIIGADPEFGWQLGSLQGHYYCGYSSKDGRILHNRRDMKDFQNEMKEVMYGQTVHLNRLDAEQIRSIARAFTAR